MEGVFSDLLVLCFLSARRRVQVASGATHAKNNVCTYGTVRGFASILYLLLSHLALNAKRSTLALHK